jgi:hypothetical protein
LCELNDKKEKREKKIGVLNTLLVVVILEKHGGNDGTMTPRTGISDY